MDLASPDWTIFKAVQTIIQTANLGSKADKMRRVWEPTYVIVYRETKENIQKDETSMPPSRRSSSLRPTAPTHQHQLLHGRGIAFGEAAAHLY